MIGLGLDYQHAHRYPEGIVQLCSRYGANLSHVSIVSLGTIDQARDFKRLCANDRTVIHHLPGVAPADPDGPHLELMSQLDPISVELNAAWVCEDIAIWRVGPYGIPYFTPPPLESDNATRIAAGIRKIEKISSIPFLAEIPSTAFVVGSLTLGEFFRQIVDQCGCKLVCDVSHVFSYSIAKSQNPVSVLRSIPLDAVWEIHISGGHVDTESNSRYIDTHSEPILNPIIQLLAVAIAECPALRAVTYEVGVGLHQSQIDNDFDRVFSVAALSGWKPNIAKTQEPM